MKIAIRINSNLPMKSSIEKTSLSFSTFSVTLQNLAMKKIPITLRKIIKSPIAKLYPLKESIIVEIAIKDTAERIAINKAVFLYISITISRLIFIFKFFLQLFNHTNETFHSCTKTCDNKENG